MKELTKQEEKIVLEVINSQLDNLQRMVIYNGYYRTKLISIKNKIPVPNGRWIKMNEWSNGFVVGMLAAFGGIVGGLILINTWL